MERKEDETLSPEERITLFVDSVDFEGFRERVNQAIKELAEILQPIVDSFFEAFKTAFDGNNGKEVVEQAIEEENSRVVHLALNHRKERVCKKNMKRFKKIVKKHKNLKK